MTPTLVLDTNTVMALWFFEDPALVVLRRNIEQTQPVLATRADALEELRRVLAYRQFAISAARQSDILARYAQRCVCVRGGGAASATQADTMPLPLPDCSDPDDQKFLEIARDAAASHLVTRDKALLRLNRHRLVRPHFAIVTPETLCRPG